MLPTYRTQVGRWEPAVLGIGTCPIPVAWNSVYRQPDKHHCKRCFHHTAKIDSMGVLGRDKVQTLAYWIEKGIMNSDKCFLGSVLIENAQLKKIKNKTVRPSSGEAPSTAHCFLKCASDISKISNLNIHRRYHCGAQWRSEARKKLFRACLWVMLTPAGGSRSSAR